MQDKKLRFKIISIAVGICLSIVLGEVLIRVYFFGLDGLSIRKVGSFVSLGESGFIQKSDNREVRYELKPNIESIFKLSGFLTNSQNFRDKEYTLSKPPNTIRGIAIGDSFTMGSGVEIDKVYHSVVEDKLNQRNNGMNYEILNFGVGGYNLSNYLGVLRSKAILYNPDFIIIGFCGNNDFKLPSGEEMSHEFIAKPRVYFKSFLYIWLRNSIIGGFTIRKEAEEVGEKEIQYVKNIFGEFKLISIKYDIPIVICYLSLFNNEFKLNSILNISAEHNLYFIDSKDEFDRSNLGKYQIVNKLDAHPNDLGHAAFAKSILDSEWLKIFIENSNISIKSTGK